jgi:hypothetical protein
MDSPIQACPVPPQAPKLQFFSQCHRQAWSLSLPGFTEGMGAFPVSLTPARLLPMHWSESTYS